MKGIILFVLFFISSAFSYEYDKQVNASNFNLDNVSCRGENITYSNPHSKFIITYCSDYLTYINLQYGKKYLDKFKLQ